MGIRATDRSGTLIELCSGVEVEPGLAEQPGFRSFATGPGPTPLDGVDAPDVLFNITTPSVPSPSWPPPPRRGGDPPPAPPIDPGYKRGPDGVYRFEGGEVGGGGLVGLAVAGAVFLIGSLINFFRGGGSNPAPPPTIPPPRGTNPPPSGPQPTTGGNRPPAGVPTTDAELNKFATDNGFVVPPGWQLYFVDKLPDGDLADAGAANKVIRVSRAGLSSPAMLRSVLRHELVHVQQGDEMNSAKNKLGRAVNQLEAVERQLTFATQDGLTEKEIEQLKAQQRKHIGELLGQEGGQYYWDRIKMNLPDRYRLRPEDRI
jgi:hypothetical protein